MKFSLNDRIVSEDAPCYVVAEMSANHVQRFDIAVDLIRAAKSAGADAIKVQLYSPETHTLPIHEGDFRIKSGLWEGNSLWELYSHTCMPWEWYPELVTLAESLEITLFPTVSDLTALEFAEQHHAPAYKIASFEIGDRDLLRAVAATGKPTFISDGCATEDDYVFVHELFGHVHCPHMILHCISEYPATPTVEVLDWIDFHSPAGLSDHTAGAGFPIWCSAFGLAVLEKHIWTGYGDCADREFSLDPNEFRFMVDAVRAVETAQRNTTATIRRKPPLQFQRSIYVVKPIAKGQVIEREDVRVIRPGYGLDPRLLDTVVGSTALIDMPYGTALKENYFK